MPMLRGYGRPMPRPIGDRVLWVRLEDQRQVPDGDGGFTVQPVHLTPYEVQASILPAGGSRAYERPIAGTVQATATHDVVIRYHPEITQKTRVLFGTRVLQVVAIVNPDETRNSEQVLLCTEVVK